MENSTVRDPVLRIQIKGEGQVSNASDDRFFASIFSWLWYVKASSKLSYNVFISERLTEYHPILL